MNRWVKSFSLAHPLPKQAKQVLNQDCLKKHLVLMRISFGKHISKYTYPRSALNRCIESLGVLFALQ